MGDVSTSAATQETSLKMKGRRLVGVLMAAALAVGGVAAAPTTAMADEAAPVNSGLNWSFVNSWGTYVTTSASGSITVSDGASKGDNNVIGFKQVDGSFDTQTGVGHLEYEGTALYESVAHGFSIAIKDPIVELTADGAKITAETSATDTSGTGQMSRVDVAELDLVDPVEANGTLTWSNIASTISGDIEPSTWKGLYGTKAGAPVTFSYASQATTVAPTVKDASTKGLEIEASIAGIPSGVGVYAALIEKGKEGEITRDNPGIAMQYITQGQIQNGAATAQLRAVASDLGRSKAYEVIVWKEHTNTSDGLYGRADVDITSGQWDAVFPPAAATRTSVKFAKSSVKYNAAASANVRVTSNAGTPSGKATLKIAGQTYNANLSKGKATIKLSKAVKVGSQKASVSFTSSDSDFKNSSTSATLKVTKATPKVTAKLAKSKIKASQKPKVKVSASIPGSLKAKASKFKVEVYDGKKKIKTQRLSASGKATVTLKKLKPGNHKIKVKVVATANTGSKTSTSKTLKVVK